MLNDEKAIRIIDGNASALADLINAGMKLYGTNAIAVASGGIFEHYGEIMSKHIAKYSDVQLRISDLPPIYGACRRACTLGGCKPSEEFRESFRKTYGGIR